MMPATLQAPEKFAAEVREQLTETAGRIRMVDLAVGGFMLLGVMLAYLAAMILVDRVTDLPSWVRQVSWLGLFAGLGYLAYRVIMKPLRERVNPLFAAKRIEETAPNGKNSVINWVDLQDAQMPESVRNAVAQKAAKYLAKADASKAAESRGLLYSGISVAVLVVALGVMFLSLKSTAFFWHAKRALNPFAAAVNAAQTSLKVESPDGGDATITEGDPLTITASVTGREPDAAAEDRVRLQIRYSPEGEFTEELPLKSLGDRRWSLLVPEQYIQRGFWYRVAGGDGASEVHRISTRTRPVFSTYELKYEYPAYLNRESATTKDAYIKDYPGTKVTITATANRTLKSGQCKVGNNVVPVEVRGDTLIATIIVPAQPTEYQLRAETDDRPAESPKFQIDIKTDSAPSIAFKPTQSPVTLVAANGLLKVDAEANDDFGVDKLTLKLRVKNGAALQSKPYRGGMSFKREKDKTWPKTLDYKDSVKIQELKLEDGSPAKLKEGQEIEYWVEAEDNCSEPKANVGRTPVYSAKLQPAIEEVKDADVKKGEEEKQAKAEKDHNQGQDAKNNNEARPKEGAKKNGGEEVGRSIDPVKPEEKNPPKQEDGKQPPNPNGQPQDNPNRKSADNVPGTDPQNNKAVKNGEGSKEPSGQAEKDAKIKEQAKAIQQELKKQKDAGNAKGSDAPKEGEQQPPSAERKSGEQPAPSTEAKPQPVQGENKPEPSECKKPGEGNGSTPPEAGGEARKPEEGMGESKNQSPPPASERKTGETKNSEPKAENKGAGEPEKGSEAKGGEPPPKGENDQAKASQPGGGEAGGEKQPDWNEVEKNARELSSENPGKREAAKQKLEDQLGKDGAKEAENLFRDPPKNPQDMKQKMDDLKKNQDELAKKNKKPPQGGNADKEAGEVAKAAEGASSNDPAQQKQAKDAMDKMTPEAKKKAEQLANDMKNGSPEQKAAAEKEVDELKKKSKETAKNEPNPDLKNAQKDLNSTDPNQQQAGKQAIDDAMKGSAKQEAENLKKDLTSPDPAKRQAAKDKMDKMANESAKKEAEQIANDLKSNDPDKRAAAEKKLDEIKKEAEKNAANQTADAKKLDEAGKEMKSGDEKTRKAGEDKLAKEMEKNGKGGDEAKKEAAELAKDLNSTDPAKKAAAEKKLDEMKKDAAAKGADAKKLDEAKNDLKNGDNKTRKEGEDKLAKEIEKNNKAKNEQAANNVKSGDENKKKEGGEAVDKATADAAKKEAEQLAKDLQSKDPATRAAAEKKLDDLKKMADNAQKQAAKEKRDDIAKGLDSKDENQQKKAADDLAKELPEGDKKVVEGAMKDKKSDDPKKREEAKKKLDDLLGKAEDAMKSGPPRGAGNDPGKPMKIDESFAKRSGDLKLEDFKKEKANEEMRKNLKLTPEDYEKFLQGFEEMSKREEAAALPNAPQEAPKVDTVNTGGAAKVEARGSAVGNTTTSGTANTPPGFAEARKKMLEATRKGSGSN